MERKRFEKDLEFVQSLCNPEYLQFLHQKNYFKDDNFLSYLKYLHYWNNEPYKNFLLYPQCLQVLELLDDPEFVNKLDEENVYVVLSEQQFNIWNNL